MSQFGTAEQRQTAIATTQTWLQQHPEDTNVRTQFLAFIGKQRTDIGNIVDLIIEQWQWLSEQRQTSQNFWSAFLPVVYHHASPELYLPIIKLAFQQHSEDFVIQNLIFGYFRDYLDQVTCCTLATNVSQSRLPPDKWRTQIYAANFFRDQGEYGKAEKIYRRTFGAARAQAPQIPQLAKAIDFINVSYAQLLLFTDPPRPNEAIRKLDWVLKKTPKHGYAHLLMAQAYEAKGTSFYIKAKNHFEKSIQFDREKRGFFSHQFGCFYRYAIGDIPAARDCFENSIAQQVNLPACVELAELDIEDGNLEQAKLRLEQGLALPLLKRSEQEVLDKLSERIALLRQQTGTMV